MSCCCQDDSKNAANITGCSCITNNTSLSKKKKLDDLKCYLSKLENKVEDVKEYIKETKES